MSIALLLTALMVAATPPATGAVYSIAAGLSRGSNKALCSGLCEQPLGFQSGRARAVIRTVPH